MESKWEKDPLPEADLLVFRGKIEDKSTFTRPGKGRDHEGESAIVLRDERSRPADDPQRSHDLAGIS
jgi:hypothetical protein